MKRFSCAVFALVLVSIQPLSAQVQGQWATTGSMQSAREFNAQARLVSGQVLSIGGVDNNNNLLASAEVYSPGPGTWALTGSMGEAPSCTIPRREHGLRQVPSPWLALVTRPRCSRAGRC